MPLVILHHPISVGAAMRVSEIMGEAVWQHLPLPKPLPIPKHKKSKQPAPKKKAKPQPFNEPKPDELS
jgi:hypothetical protein